jgi:hypothetical protein
MLGCGSGRRYRVAENDDERKWQKQDRDNADEPGLTPAAAERPAERVSDPVQVLAGAVALA